MTAELTVTNTLGEPVFRAWRQDGGSVLLDGNTEQAISGLARWSRVSMSIEGIHISQEAMEDSMRTAVIALFGRA
jgi:hypothetical protein